MIEVRTRDTARPGRHTLVTLPLSGGEALRVVLGPETARALLESLLRHPHLRNVAAMLSRTLPAGPDSEEEPEKRNIVGTTPSGQSPRRSSRRRSPSGRTNLTLVTSRPHATTDPGETLDGTRACLARSRQLIEEIRHGLERRDPATLGVKARRLRTLLAPLGAESALDAARRLEAAAARNDPPSTAAAVEALAQALVRLSEPS